MTMRTWGMGVALIALSWTAPAYAGFRSHLIGEALKILTEAEDANKGEDRELELAKEALEQKAKAVRAAEEAERVRLQNEWLRKTIEAGRDAEPHTAEEGEKMNREVEKWEHTQNVALGN